MRVPIKRFNIGWGVHWVAAQWDRAGAQVRGATPNMEWYVSITGLGTQGAGTVHSFGGGVVGESGTVVLLLPSVAWLGCVRPMRGT